MQVAITSLLVALPRTISSSRITFAGLKKWVPMTEEAREVHRSDLVDVQSGGVVARIAPGLRHAVELGKDLLLNAIPSKTASTTMSAVPKSS